MRFVVLALCLLPTAAVAQALPPNCQTTLDNLNRQETYIKRVMTVGGEFAPIEVAKTIGFYQATQTTLPAVCQGSALTELDAQLTTSLAELRDYLDQRPKVDQRPKPRAKRTEGARNDKFASYCKNRGPHSWMRINGVKRYCGG